MLILTEKPSVAAAFAAALSVPRKSGFWENDEYLVVNALGHLLENYEPEDYDSRFAKWRHEDLPIIPERFLYKAVKKTAEQLAVVSQCFESRRGDELLLATDAEREGEVIGAEILDYVGFSGHGRARRFWVSEALTPEVIRKGIKEAKPLEEYAAYKEQGFARQRADWLVGMNLTRLVTLGSGKLLTVGRVQSAILAALYERERHITAFAKEKYFELTARLRAASDFQVKLQNPGNKEFPARFEEGNPLMAAALEKIQTPAEGTVTALSKEQKILPPPQLFNLTALQKAAHKQFSYTPEETLAAAQALYEKHKCQSYPRTPSRVMGDENASLVQGIFEKLSAAYPGRAEGADSGALSGANKRVFNSAELQDHHALIPLAPLPDGATEQERTVYFLVLDQFFTAFKPAYVYNAVKLACAIQGFAFAGQGIEVIEAGWKQNAADDDEEEKTENYSGIEEGKSCPLQSITREEKWTEPKKRYTYATLLSLMENPRGEEGKHLAGLGTPATRGAILQKLSDRKYTALKGKSILITDEGKFLVESLLKNEALARFISIPETTRWEEALRADAARFVGEIAAFVQEAVKTSSFTRAGPEALGKCPLCGKNVFEGKKSYYCSGYKDEPPCRLTIWKEIAGAAVSANDAQLLLLGQKTKIKKCKRKDGKPFEAAFHLEGADVKFLFK
jgi:DNA topoisomerase-3